MNLFLRCDMHRDCDKPVTHIDDKGWIYCERHGHERKGARPCRELSKTEIDMLVQKKPISFERRTP